VAPQTMPVLKPIRVCVRVRVVDHTHVKPIRALTCARVRVNIRPCSAGMDAALQINPYYGKTSKAGRYKSAELW
jgi:hypothetical protein